MKDLIPGHKRWQYMANIVLQSVTKISSHYNYVTMPQIKRPICKQRIMLHTSDIVSVVTGIAGLLVCLNR